MGLTPKHQKQVKVPKQSKTGVHSIHRNKIKEQTVNDKQIQKQLKELDDAHELMREVITLKASEEIKTDMKRQYLSQYRVAAGLAIVRKRNKTIV